jgi:hypothetical protein
MLQSKDNTLYIDQLVNFYRSDLWNMIKVRLLFLQSRLEFDALNRLQIDPSDKSAGMLAVKADGVKTAVEVTERLASELEKNEFDADEAWVVIENLSSIKGTKGVISTWIRQILAKLINRRKR